MTPRASHARFTYDQFRLAQSQIKDDGLYILGETQFYIVCPELTSQTLALNGENLISWFGHSLRPATQEIDLISEAPHGAVRIPDRTLEEIALNNGSSKTNGDVIYDLSCELPESFPDFITSSMHGKVSLITQRDLTDEEIETYEQMKKRVGFHFEMDTFAQPHMFINKPSPKPGFPDLKILPKRYVKYLSTSKGLSEAWSEDQDLWHSHRADLLSGTPYDKSFLPESWRTDEYRCLLQTSVFPTEDFRNFLSLHDTIVAQLPLRDKLPEFLNSAKITESELLKLAEMGRLRFVMSHSVERHSVNLVEKLCEIPNAILLPRRLSCENILNLRQTAPFLMPSLATKEKKDLLALMMETANKIPPSDLKDFLNFASGDLSRIWRQIESRLNNEGPSSSMAVGLGFLADSLVKKKLGLDYAVELTSTAPYVEWASTLRASLVPIVTEGYSNFSHCKNLNSMYHGIQSGPPVFENKMKLISSEILSIGSKVSILDFAEQLQKGDLARFRRLVMDVSKANKTAEEITEAVSKLNTEIKAYESNENLLNKIDLVGFGMEFVKVPTGISWLAKIFSPFIEQKKRDNFALGAFLDTIEGAKTLDPAYRPFIARVKKNLRDTIQ